MTESVCVPLVKEYAERIGADYMFRENPDFIKVDGSEWVSQYYNCLEPCLSSEFEEYDNILYVDCDVGIPSSVDDNIFEIVGNDFDIAMTREPDQEQARRLQKKSGRLIQGREDKKLSLREVHYQSDEMWIGLVEDYYDIEISRNDDQCKKLYNAGVILFTKEGMKRAREEWLPIGEYLRVVEPMRPIDFYLADQEYINVMMTKCNMRMHDLDNRWNSRVCDYGPLFDCRTIDTKFIHIQKDVNESELKELL